MDTPLAIGIDFGGTSIKFGVASGSTVIDNAPRLNPQVFADPNALIDAMIETVESLIKKHPSVRAVGFGIPGFVHFPTGTVFELTNVQGWKNIKLKEIVSTRLGLPCAVENDANCMAIAEWKLGAGQGYHHLVCLTLGTGVGGGIIMNNQMVRGANYSAGELGQTSIDYQGRVGHWGNVGSLEEYIGNNQITETAYAAYQAAGINKAHTECTPADLSKYAADGCDVAIQCWDGVAKKLATTLLNTCYMLNPEAIVIGGGISYAGQFLFDPLNKYLRDQLSDPFKESLVIKPAKFGNEAGILGCASLAMEEERQRRVTT